MITNITGLLFTQICPNCGKENTKNFTGRSLKFLQDFGEYENIFIECDCGTIEVFNMNLPLEETSEIMEDDPQRANIKAIMRLLRPDLKG